MGKIEVRGYAEREVNYDITEINITFTAKERAASRASEEVMKQSELFLGKLRDKGVKLENIYFKGDSIDNSYPMREEQFAIAERKIQLVISFNMNFMNYIMELTQKYDGDVEYDVKFRLSEPEKIHVELRKEAMLDAKKKAEGIASVLGKRVVALKSANMSNYNKDFNIPKLMKLSEDQNLGYCGATYLSDEMQASVSKESEYIDTVWIIE